MKHEIMILQNEKKQLAKLAAFRQLYKRVKNLTGFKIFLTIIIACMGFFFADNPSWKPFILISTTVFLIIDFYLITPLQQQWKNEAAIIQEMFDTDIFKIPWDKIRVGKEINEEKIIRLCEKFGNKDELKDWYPDINSAHSLSMARSICQRSTVVWEFELRSLYYIYCLIFTLIVISGIALIGLFFGVLKFFTLIPIAINCFRYVSQIKSEISNLGKLCDEVNKAAKDAETTKTKEIILIQKSRDIQGMIFDHRKNCSVIFDFFYWIHRKSFEHSMKEKAESM